MSAEDKLDILSQIAAYGLTLDEGDDEAWIALFTEDCVWEGHRDEQNRPTLRWAGHAEMRAYVAWMNELKAKVLRGGKFRHNLTTTQFIDCDENTAHTRSLAINTTVIAPNERTYISVSAVYEIWWRKTTKGWLINYLICRGDSVIPLEGPEKYRLPEEKRIWSKGHS